MRLHSGLGKLLLPKLLLNIFSVLMMQIVTFFSILKASVLNSETENNYISIFIRTLLERRKTSANVAIYLVTLEC